jgi:hypothetical protein
MDEPINETVFGETIYKTSRKMIVASEYKGKRYLQFREMWKESESDSDWRFSKKIVSFNYNSLKELIESLKKHGIKNFDDLLLMFNPEEEVRK